MKSENSRTIRKGSAEVSHRAIVFDIIRPISILELGLKAGTLPQMIEC